MEARRKRKENIPRKRKIIYLFVVVVVFGVFFFLMEKGIGGKIISKEVEQRKVERP